MTKIQSLTYIDSAILCIYHDRIWRFEVLCSDGELHQQQQEEGFYSANAAEKAGREWILAVFG
jgi:hypothetical protein